MFSYFSHTFEVVHKDTLGILRKKFFEILNKEIRNNDFFRPDFPDTWQTCFCTFEVLQENTLEIKEEIILKYPNKNK